jgi:hypothetical protein
MVRVATEQTTTIAGGFVLVPVARLMAAWNACRTRPLGITHFRAWLACREMVARRRGAEDRAPTYTPAELATLVDFAEKRARAALRALETAGLLTWSSSAISFPEPADTAESLLVDSIGRGRGDVAIPRRILRVLCKTGKPSVIAAVLAILCRCLSRRKSGFAAKGRVKASWIARTFAISLRNAKAARSELAGIGWIEKQPSQPWADRKWGRTYRINLHWDPRPTPAGSTLTPQPAPAGSTLTPPDLQTGNPSGMEKNQEPGEPGPAGARLDGQGGEEQTPEPPRLDDVTVEDLRDDGRLMELHRQAVARQVVSPSEADRLRFAASAEHALAVGKQNPGGLFTYLVRGRLWRYATQADEDAARSRLRRHLWGDPKPADRGLAMAPARAKAQEDGGLSADARLVREVRTAVIRAGIFRDPWPAFAAKQPDWDRGRWDRAMAELGLA